MTSKAQNPGSVRRGGLSDSVKGLAGTLLTTLAARAATQRGELSQALAPWRRALAVVDQGWVAVRYLNRIQISSCNYLKF